MYFCLRQLSIQNDKMHFSLIKMLISHNLTFITLIIYTSLLHKHAYSSHPVIKIDIHLNGNVGLAANHKLFQSVISFISGKHYRIYPSIIVGLR